MTVDARSGSFLPSVFPVSFAQERLWFINQLDPNSSTYNVPATLRLSGPVNAAALHQAIRRLAERHESFRTTFTMVDGEPVQVIASMSSVELRQLDLTHLPPADREAIASELAMEEAERPFDLSSDALLRATLVKLGDDDHLLLLTTHHIVTDLWSLTVLFRDFSALYAAAQRGVSPQLPELPIQYADFAIWQRHHLQGETLDRLLSYWTRRLRGAPPKVTFPADYPRPPAQSSRGATLPFAIPCSVTRQLMEVSRKERATLFITLLTTFQALLGHYVGLDDVVVGTPLANRMRAETSDVIGFFANTLVLRADLSGDLPFREQLRRVRDTTFEDYDHQDFPFEKLVAVLNPERNASFSPLFQVLFGLQTTTGPASDADDGSDLPDQGRQHNVWKETVNDTSKFDLSFLLRQTSGGIRGGFQYCSDLYERSTIERIARHFASLIAAVAANPDARLSELLRLPEPDREELRNWGTSTRVEVPQPSVLDLFDASVLRSPEAIAVRHGEETMSYAELDVRAGNIARQLRARGVGPNGKVGLSMSRSPAMIAVLLGVLKAGAAYVPLDPAYPLERLKFMQRDADLQTVVTDGRHGLGDFYGTLLYPDDFLDPAGVAELAPVHPDQLAYVIYTSGSTGTPKGVAMPHRALVNLVAWQGATSRTVAGDRTIQITPLSFDVSLQEIFSTLCSGGELVLADESCRTDMYALLSHLEQQRIARLFAPPLLLQLLAEAAEDQATPAHLIEIIVAGEQLRITPTVRRFVASNGRCILRNQYGPSETHVATDEEVDLDEVLPSIGRPIWNTRVLLLDDSMAPVPAGAVGELYVGGVALAQGYLGRPDLTVKSFLTDPAACNGDTRLYRTGDLARFDNDGRLHFLGRADQQLKIRGFRLEPGEVEAEIAKFPGVRSVAAVGFERHPGQWQLVAYVTLDTDRTLDPSELRQWLRERLPEHAVPSVVTIVDRLLTTPSGKVDRSALTAWQPQVPYNSERRLPRSSLEQELAGIWSEVLGVAEVGIDDVFFDIGGHSLAIAQVAARVKRQLGVQLPLRTMFDSPTIASLAVDVVARQAVGLSPGDIDALLREIDHQPHPAHEVLA
ncbi:amino acid adenylation domain-containing protein [Bradyrhizobium diazoefficiens]